MKKSIRNIIIAGLVTVTASIAFSSSAFAGKSERVRNTILGVGLLGLLHHHAHKNKHHHHDHDYRGHRYDRRYYDRRDDYVEEYPEAIDRDEDMDD